MVAEIPAEVSEVLSQLLVAVLIALVGIVIAAIRKLQGKAVERMEAVSKDQGWQAAVSKLDTASQNAVAAVEQTLVREIKAASADGRLTAADANVALRAAVADAKLHIGTTAWVEILRALDLTPERAEELLRVIVEAKVSQLKGTPVASSSVVLSPSDSSANG